MKCPKCGSENVKVVVRRQTLALWLCYACEHWFKIGHEEKVKR